VVSSPVVGVLALQGDVREHAAALQRCGAQPREVREPADLAGIAGLVLPGGESTTMSLLLGGAGMWEPLTEALRGGLPALATCAGMILLAREVADGRPDQVTCGVLDISVRRNAFGRQVASFECELGVSGLGPQPFPAVFIRAPWVERAGPGVTVLAHVAEAGTVRPVMVAQGRLLAASFHPELTGDDRIHAMLLHMCRRGEPGVLGSSGVVGAPVKAVTAMGEG